MIVDAFLQIIYISLWLITSPLRLLPDASLPNIVTSSVSHIVGYILNLNNYLPLSALTVLIGVAVSYDLGYYTYKLIMWTLRRLPTQS